MTHVQIAVLPRRGQTFAETTEYAIGLARYLDVSVVVIFRNRKVMVTRFDTVAKITQRKRFTPFSQPKGRSKQHEQPNRKPIERIAC